MNKSKTAMMAALLSSAALPAFAQVDTDDIADQIIVRGVNIPDEKRATSEISAVLDEEAFARQGDSNIADALKRVTGLSLSDGKFVIVRGLNERYSSATLNGSPLPSPEPLRRVAPLDIFPTSVLSGSLVQKTYSPEFSAEFGGGAIDLRTRSLPNESFFEVKTSVELDDVSTGRDFLTYDGGDLDWLGFDDGTRSVPSGIAPFFENGPQITSANFTESERNGIDSTIDPAANFLLFENAAPVNYGVRVSGGNRYDVSDAISLGFVATLGFDTEFVTREGNRRRNTGVNNNGTQDESDDVFNVDSGVNFQVNSGQQNVDLNGLLSVGAEIYDNHEITLTGLVLRSTTKEARIEQGVNNDRNQVRNDFTEFFERQVWQGQANGEHLFPSLNDLTVNWRVAYGEAYRDSPFETRLSYLDDDEDGLFSFDFVGQENDISTFRFSRLDDENFGGGVDFIMPFLIADNNVDVKAGYAYTDKTRSTSDRTYQFFFDSGIPELSDSRFDVIAQLLPTNLLDVQQVTAGFGNPDNFEGNLEVQAGYVGIDAELGQYLRLAAGVRYEDSVQTTQTSSSILPGSDFVFDPIAEDYFLPAVTLTWNPVGNLQVRAGFSQTLVRPQFREIAPVTFRNPDTDVISFGNPFLTNSELNNYDARIEWYFSRGEFLTIGGFYKEITNAIEEIASSGLAGGDQGGSSFVNSPDAELYGFEFEFQKNFAVDEWFDSGWLGTWAQDKELVFISNYTWSQSDVQASFFPVTQFLGNGQPQVPPSVIPIAGDRSLQGQSDHIANVQLGYANYETNAKATFLFNYASERIRQVGSGAPVNRVVETPPILLDFVYSRELGRDSGFELGAKVGNILGDDYDAEQVAGNDRVVFDEYSIGRTFSLSLTKRF